MDNTVLILQILTITVSIISIAANIFITSIQSKKQSFIKVETEQWKDIYKMSLTAMAKVYSLSSPLIKNSDRINANLSEMLLHEAELRLTLKEIYQEEAELICATERVVQAYAQYCEDKNENNIQELENARKVFYFLSTIYDKTSLEFIIAQAKGTRLNSSDFERIYNKARQRFESHREIKDAIRVTQEDLDIEMRKLRATVFIEELKISEKDEFDKDEDSYLHLSLKLDSRLIGYARMKIVGKNAEISRVAVPIELRKKGIGREMVEWCEKEAVKGGCSTIQLNARKQVSDFYKNLGYKSKGKYFYEAGIKHKKMTKILITGLDINLANK